MFRKNSGDLLAPRRRDRGLDKALVAPRLGSLSQAAFFQIVEHQSKIAATGENAPGQVAEAQGTHMIERFQHRELTLTQPSFIQADPGVGKRGVGGARQLHVRAQGALLRRSTFEVLAHSGQASNLMRGKVKYYQRKRPDLAIRPDFASRVQLTVYRSARVSR